MAVPRRNPGVPSTLNVVELTGDPPHLNPKLIGYPSYQHTTLDVSMNKHCKTNMNLQSFNLYSICLKITDKIGDLILFTAHEQSRFVENCFRLQVRKVE